MEEKDIYNDIMSAVKSLGYTTDQDSIRICKIAFNRYSVSINDNYLGTYDIFRRTFVD